MFKQKITIDEGLLYTPSNVEAAPAEYNTAATDSDLARGARTELGGYRRENARDTSPWAASLRFKGNYEQETPMKEGRIDINTLLDKTRHDETKGMRKPDGETEELKDEISWDPIKEGMETADVGIKQAGKGRISGDQSAATLNAEPLKVYDFRWRQTDHGAENVKLKVGNVV